MDPVLIDIGPLSIRWYGVMIALASLAGIWIAGKEAERKGIGKKTTQDISLYAIIGGIIGARLYYVAFTDWTQYRDNPLSVLAIWHGGLAIHGAILGGILICLVYTWSKKISFWKLADTFAPALILGQAIGRIGCFFNGDAHGYPTTLPWGLVYSPESPAGQMFPGQPLHPTQLYEAILNLAIFVVVWKMRKKINVDGHLFFLYVILYSVIRIFVEHFRADKLTYFGGISSAQSIGVLGIALSLVLTFALKRKKRAHTVSV